MEARGISKTIHKGSYIIFLEINDNKAEVILKNPTVSSSNLIELRVLKVGNKYFVDGVVSFYTDEPTQTFYSEISKQRYEDLRKTIEKVQEPEDILNLASEISGLIGEIDIEIYKNLSKLADKLDELITALKVKGKIKEMLNNRVELLEFLRECIEDKVFE